MVVHNTNFMNCPLCNHTGHYYLTDKKRDFFKCIFCESIFVNPKQLPSFENERDRYLFHKNDIKDLGYLQFVKPAFVEITSSFSKNEIGLDYGSGNNSAISFLLKEKQYQIHEYDPIFKNDIEFLKLKYDYIACIEVIEHFHIPSFEFTKLVQLLKPKGKLYCMTHIIDDKIDFLNWYYKNDFTHVFFYSLKAMHWIKENYNFTNVEIKNRLIILSF